MGYEPKTIPYDLFRFVWRLSEFKSGFVLFVVVEKRRTSDSVYHIKERLNDIKRLSNHG